VLCISDDYDGSDHSDDYMVYRNSSDKSCVVLILHNEFELQLIIVFNCLLNVFLICELFVCMLILPM